MIRYGVLSGWELKAKGLFNLFMCGLWLGDRVSALTFFPDRSGMREDIGGDLDDK